MPKPQKIKALSEKLGITVKEAGRRYDIFMEILKDNLIKSESIRVEGIGVINVRHRPATVFKLRGVPFPSEAKKLISIKANKELKKRLNEEKQC